MKRSDGQDFRWLFYLYGVDVSQFSLLRTNTEALFGQGSD